MRPRSACSAKRCVGSNGARGDLFDHYFAYGCPCRFPRFRAAVARYLREIGAWDWGVTDVSALLAVFDDRVRSLDRVRVDFEARGRCDRCNAAVVRFWAPVVRDSFLEGVHVSTGDLPDVGATPLRDLSP